MRYDRVRSALTLLECELDDCIESLPLQDFVDITELLYDKIFDPNMGEEIELSDIILNSLKLNELLIKYLRYLSKGGLYEHERYKEWFSPDC